MFMRRISLLFWCIAIVLSVIGSARLVARVAAQAGRITDAQFKTLATSARTANDHAKLAAYYTLGTTTATMRAV
jgi:hypothetical protein